MDQQIIISLLGGLNFIQIFTQIFTLRYYLRKEKATTRIEEANSVGKSQDVYDRLTEHVNKEVEKMMKKQQELEVLIESQNATIAKQDSEIEMLHKIVRGYQEKCINCSINAATK